MGPAAAKVKGCILINNILLVHVLIKQIKINRNNKLIHKIISLYKGSHANGIQTIIGEE